MTTTALVHRVAWLSLIFTTFACSQVQSSAQIDSTATISTARDAGVPFQKAQGYQPATDGGAPGQRHTGGDTSNAGGDFAGDVRGSGAAADAGEGDESMQVPAQAKARGTEASANDSGTNGAKDNNSSVALSPVGSSMAEPSESRTPDSRDAGTPDAGGAAQSAATARDARAGTMPDERDGAAVEVEPSVSLTGLVLAQSPGSIALDVAATFTAVALYSDGTTYDVTNVATWVSSNNATATISAGVVTPLQPGQIEVTVEFDDLRTTTTLVINGPELVALTIRPVSTTLPIGSAVELTVVALYADGSSRDITSVCSITTSDPSVATVNGALITGIEEGVSTITATFDGLDISADVIVT